LEARSEKLIRDIDERGGMVAAIEQGFVQSHIEESAYKFGQSIETGDRVIVGVNKFASQEQPQVDLFQVPEEATARQIEKLRGTRRSRDGAKVTAALRAVAAAAEGTENLMPPILEAVKGYATVGEICTALAGVFGEYTESFN
jgi:methylmalonyl-CoA mutase N-terminal domain/subunit